MTENVIKHIEITTCFWASGFVDKRLLDHLATHAKGDFLEMKAFGEATPSDQEVCERYESTELTLVSIGASAHELPTKGISDNNTCIVLAALRYFQAAVAAGEDLTHLQDIVDLETLDHCEIDTLGEAINFQDDEPAAGWDVSTHVDGDGHLNLFVSHKDGSEVMDVGEVVAYTPEWGGRLTTKTIEASYQEEVAKN